MSKQRNPLTRTKQCAGCPWKKSTDPYKDIPRYEPEKHKKLVSTGSTSLLETSIMACHESREGSEYACVGWLDYQLGPGNNIALRMMASRHKLGRLTLDGPQHESPEEMCAAATGGK